MATDPDFEAAQCRVFEAAGIDPASRFVDLEGPDVRVHVLDDDADDGGAGGDDTPILFLHSGGTFAALFAQLLAEFDDTRTLAVDRPGFGLSGDFEYDADAYRRTIVDVLDGVLDGLGIDEVDLAGNSNGGYWSVVYALDSPERVRRIHLLGSVPTFPGTSPPVPLRMYAVPLVNRLMATVFQPSDADDVAEFYEIMGEGETIRQYPALVDAVLAREHNPRSADVDIGEMNSLLRMRGWRPGNRLREAELRDLQPPTLVVWGEDDPLGTPTEVRETVDLIPESRLEALDTGHVPWFGRPAACAAHVRAMRD